jgi:lipid A 3-O-deacylase
MRRYLLVFGLFAVLLQGQSKTPMVIGLQLDNDSFTSTYNDFYYTNGLFFYASQLAKATTATTKVIHSFRVGQQIYNPRWVKAKIPQNQNRPYAGYLFAEYTTTRISDANQVRANTFQIGIVGPGSGAESFQKWMHHSFGFGQLNGWEYQIQNAIALQYQRLYVKPIWTTLSSERVDFNLYGKATVGIAFDGLSAGVLARIRLSEKGASLKATNFYNELSEAPKEFYFFALPKINFQCYDATIQGSLFDDKSILTYNLRPLRFSMEAGIRYKFKEFSFTYAATFSTTEIENSTASGYFYGSLVGSYLF